MIKFSHYTQCFLKEVAYVKSYDGQTLMEDDDLLEKYNTIWDKFSADIKKRI